MKKLGMVLLLVTLLNFQKLAAFEESSKEEPEQQVEEIDQELQRVEYFKNLCEQDLNMLKSALEQENPFYFLQVCKPSVSFSVIIPNDKKQELQRDFRQTVLSIKEFKKGDALPIRYKTDLSDAVKLVEELDQTLLSLKRQHEVKRMIEQIPKESGSGWG